jgi:3-hydroxy-9,10-secoandrosta-1,3,5(10)-triene-9,17-dione monooxygenase reductase component
MAPSLALAVPEVDRTAVPEVDGKHFRGVLGLFATGVVAVTALDRVTGCPMGLTANSFTAVSLRPPLVSVCVSHASTTWPRIRASRGFCVNILAARQRDICLQLATPGGDKFRDLAWTVSPAGNPLLDGALGWIDCAIEAEHAAGDHVVVICRVLRLDVAPGGYESLPDGRDRAPGGPPLIFYRGGYGTFTQTWR